MVGYPAFGQYFYISYQEGRDGRPISFSDGKIVVNDFSAREKPSPGEVWLCQLVRETEKVIVVEPLIKHEL